MRFEDARRALENVFDQLDQIDRGRMIMHLSNRHRAAKAGPPKIPIAPVSTALYEAVSQLDEGINYIVDRLDPKR